MDGDRGISMIGSAVLATTWVMILMAIALAYGFRVGAKSVHAEAVERGYAERVVDSDGSTEFRWVITRRADR